MPVLRQKMIYSSDLRNNPDVLYVFGDNVERVGIGGQAREMRGEPNAHGVATKWTPGHGNSDYFYDAQIVKVKQIIDKDFAEVVNALEHGAIVVIPEDGLGTGLSKLNITAPKVLAYIEEWIEKLKRITSL